MASAPVSTSISLLGFLFATKAEASFLLLNEVSKAIFSDRIKQDTVLVDPGHVAEHQNLGP